MNKYLIPAVCAVAGVTAGFVGGFIFAKAKYKKLYEEKYEKEKFEDKKKEAKAAIDDGHTPSEEEAKKIAEGFPTELWTESFKKDQEKKKEYKNILRTEEYIDDDGKGVDKSEVFDDEKFSKENKSRCQEEFDDKLKTFSEYSGISEDALMQGSVRVISDDEYYEMTHECEPTELQWDASCSTLRSIDGDILEPEITFGEDWDEIIRRIEERPETETWVYDERLEEYYCVEVANPRSLK